MNTLLVASAPERSNLATLPEHRRTSDDALPALDVAPLRDDEAFNALVREHQDIAYSVAFRILGTREAAEDATQEAFLRAYRARAQYQTGNARAWLLRIVSNAALDEVRRRKRKPQRSFAELIRNTDEVDQPGYDPPDASPGPEALVVRGELRRTIEKALALLSDDFRLVVVLHDVHGLTYEQVAHATGVPIGTVRSRLSRARGQLRNALRTDPAHARAAGC